jgi:hypothetical protein
MHVNSQAISFSSQQEISARQLFLLQKQLWYLQDASPYYRDLFARSGFSVKDCQSLSDLQLLPLTNKSDLATSTKAENRQLANPVSTNSISCNASTQDVVSMGTVAARKAFKSVSNAKHVITLEVLVDLQALSFRNADKLGGATGRIYQILNKEFSPYDNARIFHDDLVKFRKLLFSSQIFDDLSIYWEN